MAPKPVHSLCLLRNVQIFFKRKKWNKSPSIKKKISPRYQRTLSIIVQVFYCNDFNNQSYFYTRYYVKLYVWTNLAVIHMPRRFRTIMYDSWSIWDVSFQTGKEECSFREAVTTRAERSGRCTWDLEMSPTQRKDKMHNLLIAKKMWGPFQSRFPYKH